MLMGSTAALAVKYGICTSPSLTVAFIMKFRQSIYGVTGAMAKFKRHHENVTVIARDVNTGFLGKPVFGY